MADGVSATTINRTLEVARTVLHRAARAYRDRHTSLQSALAALDHWELSHLLNRTTSIATEVPEFVGFVRSLALWEQVRRSCKSPSQFPSEQALVRGSDLYCEDAIADTYNQISHDKPDVRGGIHDLLDAVIVLGGELQVDDLRRVNH